MVLEIAEDLCAFTGSVPGDIIISETIKKLPNPEKGKRNSHKDTTKRSLESLIEKGYLIEIDDEISLPANSQ